MPQERKSLIQPGSILPPADIMSRVIQRDRDVSGRKVVDTESREAVNTEPQEYRSTENNEAISADGEPNDKATFDLPRSLYRQFKVQAATEGRPGRAILIELITQYLEASQKTEFKVR